MLLEQEIQRDSDTQGVALAGHGRHLGSKCESCSLSCRACNANERCVPFTPVFFLRGLKKCRRGLPQAPVLLVSVSWGSSWHPGQDTAALPRGVQQGRKLVPVQLPALK